MKFIRLACVAVLGLTFASSAGADIQPSELVAGNISMTGSYAVANVYCGGTYGQTYPGGRTATLEVREGNGPYRTLWKNKLPNIGPGNGYYITVPYASPVRVTTIFRLSISGTDRNNANNVSFATFRPAVKMSDHIRAGGPFFPGTKIDPLQKVRIFPK